MSARATEGAAPDSAPEAAIAAEGWTRVAGRAELLPDAPVGVTAQGRRLCLLLVDGAPVALDDRCAHAEFPLSEGELVDGELRCAWHGARFDPRSGECVSPPLDGGRCGTVRAFPARLAGDDVWVRLPDSTD